MVSSWTLLLVSVAGLRPADITAERMPALNALGDAGVRAALVQELRQRYGDPAFWRAASVTSAAAISAGMLR